MRGFALLIYCAFSLASFAASPGEGTPVSGAYFDSAGRDDVLSGGVKMIPIHTARGTFHVWTKRVGNNPTIKVLLLHGGPGATHEYLEPLDSYFRALESLAEVSAHVGAAPRLMPGVRLQREGQIRHC